MTQDPIPVPPGSHRYLVPDSGPEQSLLDKSLHAFVQEVGARSATPGGGSVAAASAAMVSSGRRKGQEWGQRQWGCGQQWGDDRGQVPQLAPPQGASLACMAGLMTYGRRQFEHLDAAMRRLIPPFHAASAKLTALVDADAQAFTACLVSAQGGQNGVSGQKGFARKKAVCP